MLIPKFSSFGAAIATLATEAFNVFWMSNGVKKERKLLLDKINMKPFIYGIILSSIVQLVINSLIEMIPLILRLFFSSCTFFGIYYLFLIIMKEPLICKQIQNIFNIIRNKKK